jgi:hypothetical protein
MLMTLIHKGMNIYAKRQLKVSSLLPWISKDLNKKGRSIFNQFYIDKTHFNSHQIGL